MNEQITIDGITYSLVRRIAITDIMAGTFDRRMLETRGARGRVDLLPAGSNHVWSGIEQADGTINCLYDTKRDVRGKGLSNPHPCRARRSL